MSRRDRILPQRRPVSATSAVAAVAAMLVALLVLPTAATADPGGAYQADGEPIAGGSSLAGAPLIPPGIHLDSFEHGSPDTYEDGTVKYYRVAVEDGQRVHAAGTIIAPPYPEGLPDEYEQIDLKVALLNASGDSCASSTTSSVGEMLTGDGPVTVASVSEMVGSDGCAGPELFVQVTRKGNRAVQEAVPVEIQIAIQPPGLGNGAPAVNEEMEDAEASPLAPADSTPIELGSSFATARALEPGSYVVELSPGQTSLASIQVQEGQRLLWRTEVTSAPENGPGQIGLRVFDASRSPVTVGGGTWLLQDHSTAVRGGAMTTPVDLGNRTSELRSVQSAWLPGTFTVMLQRLQRSANADPAGAAPVRLILTLEVEGEPSEDAAALPVLDVGEPATEPLTLRRVLLFAGAGVLALFAAVTGVAGLLVLRLRRR